MLEYVFLHYIFTQAGMHVCSVFSKCSMSLLRNNQVWLLPLGLSFFSPNAGCPQHGLLQDEDTHRKRGRDKARAAQTSPRNCEQALVGKRRYSYISPWGWNKTVEGNSKRGNLRVTEMRRKEGTQRKEGRMGALQGAEICLTPPHKGKIWIKVTSSFHILDLVIHIRACTHSLHWHINRRPAFQWWGHRCLSQALQRRHCSWRLVCAELINARTHTHT